MRAYDIVGTTKDGAEKLKFTNNKFSGIIFSLGKVYFSEDDEPRLNFNYEVHMHSIEYDKDEFEKELAEFIIERIKVGLEENSLIYTGGTDED